MSSTPTFSVPLPFSSTAVNNPSAFPALVPSSLEQPIMSDNIDYNMQLSAPFEDPNSVDWTTLQDEVMQEPWMDGFDWVGYYAQDAMVAPDNG